MFYADMGLISIIIHLILNHEYFRNKEEKNSVNSTYKKYLWAVLLYFILDASWGFIYETHIPTYIYIETVLYHIAIALTVVALCKYVTTYLNLTTGFGKFINSFGIIFAIFEVTLLFINNFYHIFFWVGEDGTYYPYKLRHFALYMQVFFCVLLAIETRLVLRKTVGEMKKRYYTIFLFCVVMSLAIIGQIIYPLVPLYSVGLIIGSSIIHTFVKKSEKEEQYKVLFSLSEIYYSMHIIDLDNDTVEVFRAKNEVKEMVNRRHGTVKMMHDVMSYVTVDEYKDAALKFTDLSTVAERLEDKQSIYAEFKGKNIGWFQSMFIVIDRNNAGKANKVIYATRIIDEEKKEEERLIIRSQTDELTGLLNRRSYEEDIYAYNDIPKEENFNYISLDLNGLKLVNDTIGHTAGDEIIIGACQCMKKCFGEEGKLYRIGGDEFVAILFCDTNKVKELLSNFDKEIAGWSGEIVDSISISYGWISNKEAPDASVRELGALAEKKMYEAKSAHYRKEGVDRRGQLDAHKALCKLYTKILMINITTDTYKIVNMDSNEQTTEKGYSDKISEWLRQFGLTGQVHPDDLEEYLKITDLNYIKNYFAQDKTSLYIFYRRKYNDSFRQVMMEIIPANDYSKDNQSLFLYVKNIDK